ncbi:DUF1796 family putative cysteine peptidase [Azospirillum himalayense]|uniref:DUF1796 family putative cysteine peptidase n=1 Tax=Azospirillum himalayense TaxID=654847 RepID=A0ABW0G4S8_9PROT
MDFPIISLGTNCEITFNLRKCFGIDKSYPFDWLITPIESVSSILRNRFEIDLTCENLEIVGDGKSVINKKYRILHHHDFIRSNNGAISGSWQDEIESVRSKYIFLSSRFFDDISSTKRAIFVVNRDGGHDWLERPKGYALSSSYAAIASEIRRTFPGLNFRLAVFNATDEGVRQVSAEDGAIWVSPSIIDYGDREGGEQAHFAGSLRGWEEALKRAVADF